MISCEMGNETYVILKYAFVAHISAAQTCHLGHNAKAVSMSQNGCPQFSFVLMFQIVLRQLLCQERKYILSGMYGHRQFRSHVKF